MLTFEDSYDGESFANFFHNDIDEAFELLPRDEHGFIKGSFKVSIVWSRSEDSEK